MPVEEVAEERLGKEQNPEQKATEEEGPEPSEAREARKIHGMSWFLVVTATISSMFLFGLDQTITADVQPAVINRFDSVLKLPWISVTLLLGASASNLFWGQVYSNYNAKWVFLFNFVVFELGSTLCAASPTINVLIGGRSLAGFGGTGMYNGVMTILSMSTSEKERALYMSIPGLAWGSSTVLGPIIGGAFTVSKVGWRWGFYINLLVGAIVTPVYLFLVPSIDPFSEIPWTSQNRLRGVDIVGFIILLGCFICLLMGINFGGLLYAWDSGTVIALFVVAGILCIAFWIQQSLAIGIDKRSRSMPLQFLSNPTLMVNFFNQTCSATACFLPIYFVPLFFQFIHNDSALLAGVRLLPYMAFLVFTVISEGFIMSNLHVGRFNPWFLGGGILVLIGSVLMYTVDANTSTAKIYGYTILLGTGTGAYLQMPFAVAQSQVEPSLIPVAISFTAFAQLAAPAITLSIANTVFLNKALRAIRMIVPNIDMSVAQRVLSGAGKSFLDSLPISQQVAIKDAIVTSMRNVYILVITAGSLTVILTSALVLFGTVSRKGRSSLAV